jgi:hypothetical protein
VLQGYGKRAHTRTDHLALAAKYLGWKGAAAGSREMKELEQFLWTGRWSTIRRRRCSTWHGEYLLAAKVIRPGPIVLAKMIGSARKAAGAHTAAAGGSGADAAGGCRVGDDPAGVAEQPGPGCLGVGGEDLDRH